MNVVLAIGKGIEADVKDVAEFFDKLGTDIKNIANPRAMLALAVLAGPLGSAIVDVTGAVAAGGLNIPLDIVSAEMLIQLWPDLKTYFDSLAVKPVTITK